MFTVRVNLIGAELRRYREAAGLTLAEVQKRIGLHPTLLNRMELGGRTQSCEDVAALLAIYGVMGEERRQLLELTRETERTTLLQHHSAPLAQRIAALKVLESQAIRVINFECQVIPGLLQTVPYAQAIIRPVGMVNQGVMREQLVYLTEVAERHNVSVRVIPRSVGNHPGFDGSFLRIQFRDHVLVELLSVALGDDTAKARSSNVTLM